MLHRLLEARLQTAVRALLPEAPLHTVQVRPCPDPRHGDYQSNALMSLARERKMNPRQLATDVLAHLEVSEWCEPPQIAGAGFLNFRLKPTALAQALQAAAGSDRLFYRSDR